MFGQFWKDGTEAYAQPNSQKCGNCLGRGELFKTIKISNVADVIISCKTHIIKCEACKGNGQGNSAMNAMSLWREQ